MPPPTYDIFMDGSCAFCRWTQSKLEPYDPDSKLKFLDYNDPAIGIQAPFPRAALNSEMHVRTPDGKWLKGFAAWVVLLRALPGLSWLGRIAGVPPVRWIGPMLYAFIARHRYRLPGAPARCEGDTCSISNRPSK